MATFYILAENDDRLLSENGTDLLVKEDFVTAAGVAKHFLLMGVGRSWIPLVLNLLSRP